jgi:hypothetical protein
MKLKKSNTSRKPLSSPETHYVKPHEMWKCMQEYYETPEGTPVTVALGEMINKISSKIAYMPCFINYTYREEMESDAKLLLIQKLYQRKFNLTTTYELDQLHEDYIVYKKVDKKTKEESLETLNLSPEVTVSEDQKNVTIRNNPFAYFSRIAYHCFVNRIKKEKKQEEIVEAYRDKIYSEITADDESWQMARPVKSNHLYDDFDENEATYNDYDND